jgi:hypothetical protein
MRPAPALFLPLSLSLLLAGCAGEGPAAPPPVEDGRTGEPPAPEPAEAESDFGWLAAGGAGGTDAQAMSSNAMAHEVGKGAARLVANVTWMCASPSCELHAYLCAPDESPVPPPLGSGCSGHAVGASPLSLVAEGPEPGEWRVSLHSDGATAGVSGTITMAVVAGRA